MEHLRTGGVDLAYAVHGEGPQSVVLSHGYLLDHRHFDDLIEALAPRFRVIAYDHRDHGQSGRARAPYGVDDLVSDAVRVIEHLDAAPCHFVGLSTGGFVGMRLALRRPGLVRRLVLMATSAEVEPRRALRRHRMMFAALRLVGTRPLTSRVMATVFSSAFLQDPAQSATIAQWRARVAAGQPSGYVRFGRAIFARDDILGQLGEIRVPTRVVVGSEDRALPPKLARHIAEAIPGASLVVIPGAGHLCTVEAPGAVRAAVVPFLTGEGA